MQSVHWSTISINLSWVLAGKVRLTGRVVVKECGRKWVGSDPTLLKLSKPRHLLHIKDALKVGGGALKISKIRY